MTKINIEQIEKIAKLAHIALTNEQKEQFSEQVSEIISWVESLNEVVDDSSYIELDKSLKLREDESKLENSKNEILVNAPDHKYDFYSVPKFVANE